MNAWESNLRDSGVVDAEEKEKSVGGREGMAKRKKEKEIRRERLEEKLLENG